MLGWEARGSISAFGEPRRTRRSPPPESTHAPGLIRLAPGALGLGRHDDSGGAPAGRQEMIHGHERCGSRWVSCIQSSSNIGQYRSPVSHAP